MLKRKQLVKIKVIHHIFFKKILIFNIHVKVQNKVIKDYQIRKKRKKSYIFSFCLLLLSCTYFSFLKSDAQALAAKVAVCSSFLKKLLDITLLIYCIKYNKKAKQAKAAAEK